jgi:hypothetical protein
MSEDNEIIYDSPTSVPEDDFWLEHGKQMVTESLPAIRSAANALIMAVGVMEAIYMGILGFGEFIPTTLLFLQKIVFATPLLIWLGSIYCCIGVVMTRELEIYLYSPEEIKNKSTAFVIEKQRQLKWGFWLLVVGLVAAFVLFVVRLYWKTS